jgi:hypothetical protein
MATDDSPRSSLGHTLSHIAQPSLSVRNVCAPHALPFVCAPTLKRLSCQERRLSSCLPSLLPSFFLSFLSFLLLRSRPPVAHHTTHTTPHPVASSAPCRSQPSRKHTNKLLLLPPPSPPPPTNEVVPIGATISACQSVLPLACL